MRKGVVLLSVLCVPYTALAQGPAAGQVPSIQLPTIIVTAQKEPAVIQRVPVSVTAVSGQTLAEAGITLVRDAALYVPNAYFSDFTARKLSNARFRGIGSSPANPAVTTYVDGVPQLNANTSSLDLVDVDQIEFVRGPQSALFGRNALAGVINVTTPRPSRTEWRHSLSVPLGNHDAREIRAAASGPLAGGRVGVGGAFAYARRDAFTRNSRTGNDVDSRSGFTGKGQVLWAPSSVWETRVIVAGERARDGDYALNDLNAVRATPFRVARDFEGHTHRNILATTVLARRSGTQFTIESTTGVVSWKTEDVTDLDYTALPLVRRTNNEESVQFTQEVRVASAANAPAQLFESVPLRWQGGVFLFTQNYEQDAVNALSPFVLSPFVPVAVSQHSPQSTLDDVGVGFYGQGTATVNGRIDVTVGARLDHESKEASLNTFFTPAIAPGRLVEPDASFTNVSPQVSVALHARPDVTVYGTVANGFKAGGFNAASPPGFEAYGEERTWNLEAGVKTMWASGRVMANAAVFRISWDDLQLNLPDPGVAAQFYIANVGKATSSGLEVELHARAYEGVDLFAALGVTNAEFSVGSVSSGVAVGGNDIPNTPDYTAAFGGQISREVRAGYTAYGRADVVRYGAFMYDDLNRAGQDSYSLANFRGGVRRGPMFVEAWVRNAFDTRYVPVAFAFDPSLAPSGFLGEPGAPRTAGVTAGVSF